MATSITNFIPTLIVGIGGTGSKTINQLVETTRDQEFVQQLQKNGLFRYIALDTDSGEQSQLEIEDNCKILISENVNIANYSRLRRQTDEEKGTNTFSWMPPESEVGPGFYNFNIEGGAGQLRLYSRLAFEVNIDVIIRRLEQAINELFNANKESLASKNKKMNIYLVCSIAGGTGSGCFLQTAALIKYLCKKRNIDCYINGVFFTPDVYKKGSHIPQQQHPNLDANAYACIKEIEAFNRLNLAGGHKSIPAFSEDDYVFHFLPNAPLMTLEEYGPRPIDNVYLIEATNQNAVMLDVSKNFKAYEKMVADALYCLIFSPIQTKATSILNNTSTANLESGNNYYRCYGSFGSGRVIFPVRDIAKYCAFKFNEEIICKFWEEIEKTYDEQIKLYEKQSNEGNFDIEEPQRHEVYIERLSKWVAAEEGICPPEIRQAVKQYEFLTIPSDKNPKAKIFALEILIEFARQFTEIFSKDVNCPFTLNNQPIVRNINVTGESANQISLQCELNPTHIADAFDPFRQFFERSKLSSTQGLKQKLEDIINAKNLMRDYFKEKSSLLRQTLRDLIFDDNPPLRANLQRVPQYMLIRYITFSETEKERNLFFVRYFLSQEINNLDKIISDLRIQLNQARKNIETFEKNIGFINTEQDSSTKDNNYRNIGTESALKRFLGLDVANRLIRHEDLEATTEKYIQNLILHEIINVILKTLELILQKLSYDKFKGKKSLLGGSNLGLLQIFHDVADYIRNDMRYQFNKIAQENKNFSSEAPESGFSIKGVYHSPASKENIWERHMKSVARDAVSKMIETQQTIMHQIEFMWRRLSEDEGIFDKVALNTKRELHLKDLKKNLIDRTNRPAEEFFVSKLREKYDIISALIEEIVEVKNKNNISKDDPIVQKEIMEDLSAFYSGIAPYAKIDKGDELQEINVSAYSPELDRKYDIARILNKISQSASVASVPLSEEDSATLDNKNEILFLRLQTASRVDRFPNIKNYRQAYDMALICRHLDYNWTFRLPEFIYEDEIEFYNLFAFAETIGFIELKIHARKKDEPQPTKTLKELGEYAYYPNFFSGRKGQQPIEMILPNDHLGYKSTIWAFRKVLNTRQAYEPKSYKQLLLEKWRQQVDDYHTGKREFLTNSLKRYNDYQERLDLFYNDLGNAAVPILSKVNQGKMTISTKA